MSKRINKKAIALTLLIVFTYFLLRPFISEEEVEVTEFVEPESQVTQPEVAVVQDIPDFNAIANVKKKKKAFFNYLIPAIRDENARILSQREILQSYQLHLQENKELTDFQKDVLKKLGREYRLRKLSMDSKGIERLMKRVDIIPELLVLMQAANESGWGTSRFARQGYNFFGLWCYVEGCGFVPARRDDGAVHEVAKFDSVEEAVQAYIKNINCHNAYKGLREIRSRLRMGKREVDEELLATGLVRYSERGIHYVMEIIQMMRVNKRYLSA